MLTEEELRALLAELEQAADIGVAYERCGHAEIEQAERELEETRERVITRLLAALAQARGAAPPPNQ